MEKGTTLNNLKGEYKTKVKKIRDRRTICVNYKLNYFDQTQTTL